MSSREGLMVSEKIHNAKKMEMLVNLVNFYQFYDFNLQFDKSLCESWQLFISLPI